MANIGTYAAAQILTAAELNKPGGAYTSFTPSWGGITLGSATNLGRYEQIGRTCVFHAHLTFSGTTVTGGMSLTLPFTAARVHAGVFTLIFRDASVGDYPGIPRQASTTVLTLNAINTASTYAIEAASSSIIPVGGGGWADGDILYVSGCYETSADPA